MNKSLREQLFELADSAYKEFTCGIVPDNDTILGVRLPILRKLAKEIVKGDWRGYLKTAENKYYEEIMLQGIVIGYVKANAEERLDLIRAFVPKIDNWSVCDSFCIGLKFTKTNMSLVFDFLQPYFSSKNEYEMRFGIVMLLNYYIVEDYINRVLKLLDKAKHEGYYVKMAAAWAISICYVKFPEKTTVYLKNNTLDDFTYNKALQKIIESLQVDKEAKDIIRSMKRK